MDTGLTDRPTGKGGHLTELRSAPDDAAEKADEPGRFRRTLVRVMLVQVITLIILWLVQSHYSAR